MVTSTSGDMQEVLDKIKKHDIQLVRFEMSDVYGISHMKCIPSRHFASKAKPGIPFIMGQIAFDPQSAILTNTGYWEEVTYGDAVYVPDLSTFQIVPWQNRTARVLMRATDKGKLMEGYPRNIAERQIAELRRMGYSILSAHEFEFYVVEEKTRKPVTNGCKIRATIRMGENQKFIDQIRDWLPVMGVDLESIETEYGPGQFEISYKPAFGVRSADNALTYKTGIKEIARLNSLCATFMGKPYPNQSGSGGHFNHSLWNADGTKSVMYDETSSTGLSKIAEHWIAGILYHAPALTVLFSPTVNCLTRLRKFSFAPAFVTWGIDNRTCSLRVKVDKERSYIENRMCSAAVCPYTSLAAMVAAGIDGIKNKYELPPKCDKVAYNVDNIPAKSSPLPNSMESALECLLCDDVIKDAMGADFIKCFVAVKKNEQKLLDEAIAQGKEEFQWSRDYFSEYL